MPFAQKNQSANENLIYVDNHGIIRYTKTKQEASFFGVNYTVPFAYGYRSHKALNVDLEKAITADVYHMARLGLNAFRVHVWDVEISDSLGNLLQNEHLRLFDYLLYKLKERNIKILITPIAFWGNGYPEPDIRTNGFSYVYTKSGSVVKEEAFKAQENYLQQFFRHVNPYTKLSYRDDPDVIAMEINNEPHHSGPKEITTEYVNRMAAAVKSTGWTKPIFYNISESPRYADAIVKAKVDGYSFQWYPTGLVANHERKGNFLPNVDRYSIPFGDTIPSFKKRALMVYEFDAGDVMQPIMYPAMARSYRTAGFQWATQFAYDPLYTAYGNTEYQTHYLNLVYTPAKAISLLIASKAFHKLPRNKSYGTYPADTLFDVFRVSYKEQLSEMNSEEEFYYTNSTKTQPKNISKLKLIAGVGSSPVVHYEGTGAYFLDKIQEGVWRLEVFPDAIQIRDPFERASPKKEVVRIESRRQLIKINLPGFEREFSVSAENEIESQKATFGFFVQPGRYRLSRIGYNKEVSLPLEPLVSVKPFSTDTYVYHQPLTEVSSNKPFVISATVSGIDTSDQVSIELRPPSNRWRTIEMKRTKAYNYKADVPVDLVTPGIISYRILIRKSNGDMYTFPGGFKGNPFAWDEYRNETWQTFVASPGSNIELLNPNWDRTNIMLYNPDWRKNTIEYITAERPRQLILKASMSEPVAGEFMGWQYYFGDKISGRMHELPTYSKLVVRARAEQQLKVKVSIITSYADAFASSITLTKEWKEIEIPLSSLQRDSFLLLPRPYPGFLPLKFKASSTKPFNIVDAERIEISFGEGVQSSTPISIEVESAWLKK
jgi:hypothetical protein